MARSRWLPGSSFWYGPAGSFGPHSLADSPTPTQVPQLIENYKQGSAEGISLLFLVVWFVGDIANLAGALWAGLVPTVIALAVYFCIADTILISQCLYYNFVNARREARRKRQSIDSSEEPLLSRQNSNVPPRRDSIGLPGSHLGEHRRSSASSRTLRARHESLADVVVQEEGGLRGWIKNTLSILAICVIGAVGWAIAWKTGVWKPAPSEDQTGSTELAVGPQILGYFSAVCYLGARIPQIVKNHREKSCEGLSLLFFLLSLVGNLTYGAGVSGPRIECLSLLTTNRFCSTPSSGNTCSRICRGWWARSGPCLKTARYSHNSTHSRAITTAR